MMNIADAHSILPTTAGTATDLPNPEARRLPDRVAPKQEGLRLRFRSYALAVLSLYDQLPSTGRWGLIGRQLARSGTSVGAHQREAYRARSSSEFVSKLEVALQELDEATYWLELLQESPGLPSPDLVASLHRESDELTRILVAAVKKTKAGP